MPEPLIIDPQAIENLRALTPDDDDAFLRELIGIFLEDTPQRIQELELSLAAGDAGKFCRAAHSIKGSSSNLGAEALRLEAEQLELRVKTEAPATLAAEVASVRAAYDRTRAEFLRLFPAP